MPTKTRKYTPEEVKDAADRLRALCPPGTTVYTVLRHVSRSGMRRRIDLYAIHDNRPVFLTGYACAVCGWRRAKREQGAVVDGCGMDMGFALVYDLGRALWPNGTDKPHGTRNGAPDNDGGYALKHEWL